MRSSGSQGLQKEMMIFCKSWFKINMSRGKCCYFDGLQGDFWCFFASCFPVFGKLDPFLQGSLRWTSNKMVVEAPQTDICKTYRSLAKGITLVSYIWNKHQIWSGFSGTKNQRFAQKPRSAQPWEHPRAPPPSDLQISAKPSIKSSKKSLTYVAHRPVAQTFPYKNASVFGTGRKLNWNKIYTLQYIFCPEITSIYAINLIIP